MPKTYKDPKDIKDTLPNKPSELIKVALKDLNRVEKSPLYRVSMDVDWHTKYSGKKRCSVCLAGSVMAGLGLSPEVTGFPCDFKGKLARKLEALNDLRQGNIVSACNELRIKTGGEDNVEITSYAESKKKFKKDMRELAKYLKKKGL